MKTFKQMSFTQKIQWRIRTLWFLIIAMLIYMVAVAEMGGGDSRVMTPLADTVSRIMFFGGLGYTMYRLCRNKKLLKDRMRLKEQMQKEQDERNQYLHDKSGGIVVDILLIALLIVTCTASMFEMKAFYMAYAILLFTVALKGIAYLIYSRMQ